MDIPGESFQSRVEAVGHGKDEHSFASMASARFFRAEYSCRCAVTHAFQFSEDMEQNGRASGISPSVAFELGGDDALNVLEEDESRSSSHNSSQYGRE